MSPKRTAEWEINAKNIKGPALKDLADRKIMVCGIASEYRCRETALEFDKAGIEVEFLSDKVAYVNKADHKKNLTDLKDKMFSKCGEFIGFSFTNKKLKEKRRV